jgi:hypothetical protein
VKVKIHPLVKVKFKDFSRTFKALFQLIQGSRTGKIFENGTDLPSKFISLYLVILIKITNVGTAGG